MRTGNVFTVPPGCDFLSISANALIDGQLIDGFRPKDDPLLLSTATIYVPNRRAARALSTAFLSLQSDRATLLPKIRTLGDTDEDEFGISQLDGAVDLGSNVISTLDRKFELASLIQQWQNNIAEETKRLYGDEDIKIPTSAADAFYLAAELSDLLTQIIQEEAAWEKIRAVVPEEHAEWWRLTSTFLQIVMEFWPNHLSEKGLTDPAIHALQLLKKRARQLVENPPPGPVIVMGTTGSVPSTQALLKSVSGLKNGAIVFPGVDMEMRADEWERLQRSDLVQDPLVEAQPQFGLARTLNALGVDRENLIVLGSPSSQVQERSKLINRSLSLADFTADWLEDVAAKDILQMSEAFNGFSFIDAANERQEALAIAVAMREVLEEPEKTAALVTPDRTLARRVSRELERFGIAVDDSGGSPLVQTPAAGFLRQIVSLCFGECTNPMLTALFKGGLATVGLPRDHAAYQARLFELVMLRGTLQTPETGAFANALAERRQQLDTEKHVSPRLKMISEAEWDDLFSWAEKIDHAFQEFMEAVPQVPENPSGKVSLATLASAMRHLLLQLSSTEDGKAAISEAYGADELDTLLEQLQSDDAGNFFLTVDEIPAVLDALLSDIVCRTGKTTHSRLHIFGPLEVRLLDHDRVILGGLNEDTWPQNNRVDAFLNRSIRRELGLPSPERRTGLAAHDFQQLTAKSEVIVSRAGRVDKAPTVTSRWLQRLFALLGDDVSKEARDRGSRYLSFANALDFSSERGERAQRPAPTPPVSARPRRLPVTDVETWIRDPYALYAKRILKLRPIDPLEREPDPLLKGTLYHAIMQDYVEGKHYSKPTEGRLGALKDIAARRINAEHLRDDVALVWQLRFEEIAERFVAWEADYLTANNVREIHSEIEGELLLGEHFTLTARADRIEVLADGRVNVLDYKTGGNPTEKQARGLSPQLALEGLIAQNGGFTDVSRVEVNDLKFIRLRRKDKLETPSLHDDKNPLDDIIKNARDNLIDLIHAYQEETQAYVSRHAPFKDSEMSGDYDHLARTREWSFGEEDSGDG